MFAYQDTVGVVDVAFTDRHGGASSGAHGSLNLGHGVGDERDRVERNLEIVAAAFARHKEVREADGSPQPDGAADPLFVTMNQVHGADVAVVDGTQPAPVADAIVTGRPAVVLAVRVADCVPVLLADVERSVVGAAHAGRQGMVAGVVPNVVRAMRDLGARDIRAWVGPHVCGRCYEVPAAMRRDVSAVVPQAYAHTSWGTPSVDVGAGVTAQLMIEGVQVSDVSRCTMEDDDLFSYRRQGQQSGRLAGLIWVRP